MLPRTEVAEVEAALAGVPGLEAIAVCVSESATTRAPCLVAFVVGAAAEDELRAALRAELPDDATIAAILTIEALPRAPSGDIDRPALDARAAEAMTSLRQPRTATEVAVAAIWQELGCTPASADDDFFLAGGHSLLAAQLGAQLGSLFEVEVPLPLLFDEPTVAAQAAWLDRAATRHHPRLERHERRGSLPLSFAQERMWFFDELTPGTTVHRVQRAFRIEGPLDRAALLRAIDAVARRHEALRTIFVRQNGVPCQQILDAIAREHRDLEAGDRSEASDANALRTHFAEELRRPFNLARGPLWRTSLVQLASEIHVLVITLHHLIADAWSLNVWAREVAEHYRAERSVRPPILAQLVVQPADLAAWQRRAIADGALDPHRAFWRTALAHPPAGIELPTDHPRSANPSYRGHHVRAWLEPAVVVRLRAVGQQHGCTLFMTLLAALDVLLARLSGQEDLIVGTPVVGRDYPETRELIGLFLNTIPIRVDASGDPTFEALLDRVREATQHALAHAAVPYERIVADLALPREAGRHPVFDVMLNLVPPSEPFELADLRVTPITGRNEAGPLDLVVTFVEQQDGGLAGNVRCAKDLFDATSAERFARRFETVVAALAGAPDVPISRTPILDEDERTMLAVTWNSTEVEIPAIGVHERFEAQVRRTPHALATDDGKGTRLSYADLSRRVDQIVHALFTRGLGPEAIVGIHVDRSPDLAASVLGVLSAGAAFALLDPTLPAPRLTAMLEDAEPRWIITHRRLVPTLPDSRAQRLILEDLGDVVPPARARIPVRGDDLAYLMYTSGSTGRPKGVAVSHRSLVNRIEWVRRTFPFTRNEVVCQKTSIGFIDTLWELLGPLTEGLPCVLPSDDIARDPAALSRVLDAHGVTRIMLVPSLLRALLRIHRAASGWLPKLNLWLVGGEDLPPDLAAAFRQARPDARLVNLYGLSEVAGESTWHEVHDVAGTRIPIGVPGPNTRAYVVDPRGELVPVGVWGELWIGGAGVARGYHRRPDDTRARFFEDPFHPGGRVFRTGDRARRRADGTLELAGRLDTQLKIRGVRVEPAEVEQALRRHPAVHDAAVTAIRGLDGENRLVAYLTSQADALPDARELRQFLRASLAEPLVPTHIIPLDSLPLGPAGKVDLTALPQLDLRSAPGAAHPLTATEAVVAETWAAVLGSGPIGVEDDFFARGGYSLLVAQLATELSRAFAIDIPLALLFESSTVALQAARIDEVRRAGVTWPPLVRVPRAPRMPLSFVQERMWFFDELTPGTTVHRVQRAFRIEGPLDRAALLRAIDAIARRHEALRTIFVRENGLPCQQILDAIAREHRDLEAGDRSEASDANALRTHFAEELRRPFDLARGPLWRTSLVQLASEIHVLVITLHHLIADAWSLNVWAREVAEHYRAERSVRPPILAQLVVQPADLAAWQRRAIADGALDPHRAFWRTALAHPPAGIELPTDHPRSANPSYRGHHVRAWLEPAVVVRLRAVGQQHGCTLFMTLLAALDVLLARLSGQEDLIVGTPVVGRDYPETRELIGLFLNTIPIRVDASGDPTFEALLDRVREATQHALAHAAVPYERIVADLALPREAGRHPVFDVMLNLVPPSEPFELADLRVTPITGRNEAGPLDLVVTFVEQQDGGLAGNVRCAKDLFDATSAERFARRFETVVAALAGAPDVPISRTPILDEDERTMLAVTWNSTEVEIPAIGVHERFEAQVRRTPHALATDDGKGTRLSYADLSRRVDQIVHALFTRGLGPEAIVGIHVDRSPDLAASVLGVLSAGAAFALLDPTLPAPRLTAMLEDAEPRWIITHRRLVPTLPDSRAQRLILEDLGDVVPPARARIPVRGDDLAYLMYTSGSTGRPKGVAVSHRSLVNRIEWVRRTFPFTRNEVVCQKTSIGFIDTLWELLGPLTEGLPCVLPSDDIARDPAALSRVLDAHGVTRIMLVPSLLRALLRIHRAASGWLPKLNLWLVGGEDLPPDLAAAFRQARPDARLVNLYGLSEVAGESTWHEVHDVAGTRIPIGVPGPNTRAYVVDPRGELVPVGVWGELWIGGAGVARGYHRRPDDTRARFFEDPFHPGGRVFRTGDRARRRADGTLELAGRLDTQLKIRGVRVEPAEVEQALRRHPAVHDAAVTAIRGLDGENRLVAYLTSQADALPDARELRQFLRASLAEPLVPTHIIPLDSLPLGPAGKVDLTALPQLDLRSAPGAAHPLTATEAVVAETWAAVLGSGPIGVEDDFFARGGYSLLVAQLATELSRAFAIDIPLALLFESSTVALQAARIDEVRRAGVTWPPLVRVPRAPRMPLSFVQERMWFAEATHAGMPLHVLTMALRLSGRVDEDRLEHAMDSVAARHEGLRTTFAAVDGVPYQVLHAHGSLPRNREVIDLSALTSAARHEEIMRMQADEKGRPFDLAAGPPWRTRLVRLGPEAHVLLVAMHHLVSDGWSMHRWIEEVGAHYAASPGQVRPRLVVQPADVAMWQRRSFEDGTFDRARAYWRERLTRTPVAELPSDGPRDRSDGGWVAATLAPAHVAAVRSLARSQGSSIFMVLLAALDLLISELTGDDDVTIGTLVAGRDHPFLRPLIGAFLNTLPLRVDVSGATNVCDVLPRARDATRRALAHGDVPFERIVADVNPTRIPRRNPLFDVALNYVPPGLPQRIGDLAVSLLEPSATISVPFDVMWRVIERGRSLQLRVEYRRGRFTAERIQTWLDRYLELLSPDGCD